MLLEPRLNTSYSVGVCLIANKFWLSLIAMYANTLLYHTNLYVRANTGHWVGVCLNAPNFWYCLIAIYTDGSPLKLHSSSALTKNLQRHALSIHFTHRRTFWDFTVVKSVQYWKSLQHLKKTTATSPTNSLIARTDTASPPPWVTPRNDLTNKQWVDWL